MSCISASFTKLYDVNAKFTRITDFHARFALVCGAGIGREFLYASDGILLTVDGGKIIVKKMV